MEWFTKLRVASYELWVEGYVETASYELFQLNLWVRSYELNFETTNY